MTSLEAVIEIGSTGIRLLVAEITDSGQRNTLDRSEMPVSLGHDVFTSGSVSSETLLRCIQILLRFREQLVSWNIQPDKTSVIATNAVREAKNRDPFVDRIQIRTGFHVQIIDGIENNRLTYLAVTDCLKGSAAVNLKKDAIIIEVGGGSTELMLIEKGKMAGAHSMRIGTVIVGQQLRSMLGTMEDAYRYIEEFIFNTKGSLDTELALQKIKQFIAVGSDARIAAANIGEKISPSVWELDRQVFDDFVDKLQTCTIDECAAQLRISYSDAQSLQISLLIYKLFLKFTNVKKILVAETSIREGLIISKTVPDTSLQQDFYSQITASAKNILRKYRGDEKHADFVRKISLKFYDELKEEIALPKKARLLLEISAILHDVGMFIRAENHNLHSQYIIANSEIFGLGREDITIISLIALYHRDNKKPQDDKYFQMLPSSERMTILKLTAILRIADALDRSHMQKFTDFSIKTDDDTITIITSGDHNTTLENVALAQKADMFESFFGYKIIMM
ncbi:HD domain-containing protein [Treponema parvum]|uniref:HD domain-containing protein n=1 Tax=Treponema parvum TaxID=138851 RepID=A0A975F0X3_9SPIR|nr:HD domain-containing protein [Treponema parvum]QTQ12551.1 HD domain-containing protein [Treponema parvum]